MLKSLLYKQCCQMAAITVLSEFEQIVIQYKVLSNSGYIVISFVNVSC